MFSEEIDQGNTHHTYYDLLHLYFVFVHALSMPHTVSIIQSNAAKRDKRERERERSEEEEKRGKRREEREEEREEVEVKYKKYIYLYILYI